MKKISALALAAMLALSMSAFAGSDGKTCELKDANCKKSEQCDKSKCEKTCDKSCEKKSCTKAEKKAS